MYYNYTNNNMHQRIPLEDRYEILCEKLRDEGIECPAFEEFNDDKERK